jgi:hypothetical protein
MRHTSSFSQKIPTSVTPNFARGLRTNIPAALDINALIRNNILGLGTTPQIGIMKSLDTSEFSGHPIIFDEPLEPRILEDASQDLIVLSPGLGGGSSVVSLYGSWLPISELFGNMMWLPFFGQFSTKKYQNYVQQNSNQLSFRI